MSLPASAVPEPREEHDSPLGPPIPDGPWMQDVWVMWRPKREEASGTINCAVANCERPAGCAAGDVPRETDVLCVPHRRRLRKMPGASESLASFIEEQATASPILRRRGANTRKPDFPPVIFALAPAQLRADLRYVTAIKIKRNQWRNPEYVNAVLRSAIQFAADKGHTCLSDFAGPTGLELAGRRAANLPRPLCDALPTMLKVLEEAHTDPWESAYWHPGDFSIKSASGNPRPVKWDRVTCDWLRVGLMRLAREHIQSGYRSWNTLGNYVRAGSLLSAYMDEVGHLTPPDVTRGVFLDFLGWVRTERTTRTDLGAVNTAASLLFQMQQDGIVPDLPETMFLLRGENPTTKVRHPKPLPADILEAIDTMIEDDSAVIEDDVRLLLRLFRAVGPRASEALHLPVDCIRHTDRGYSIEYFQSKVQDWRRVPLPPRLGEHLAAQARQVKERHGAGCPWLFPYFGPAPRVNHLVNDAGEFSPWSYYRFRDAAWAAYRRAGIVQSALTGETLGGPQLHRFRHTVATGLLNEGWSQYEVQRFLGHKSPTMMQSYAEIHEDSLRAKYVEFIEKSVDISGTHHELDVNGAADVERLRDRLVRTTLPNGYCTLPEKQTCDFVPTPCLSCTAFFRTTPTFLPIHIRQRDEAMREIDLAKTEGRDRAVQAHEQTVDALNRIIDGLQEQEDDPEAS